MATYHDFDLTNLQVKYLNWDDKAGYCTVLYYTVHCFYNYSM